MFSALRVPDDKAAIVVSRDDVLRVGPPHHRLQLLLANEGGETAGGCPEVGLVEMLSNGTMMVTCPTRAPILVCTQQQAGLVLLKHLTLTSSNFHNMNSVVVNVWHLV